MANDKVKFLDTTLRDGEQSAGIGMTVEEKMEIAKQLEKLRVDVIEAGFAASSPGDFQAVSNIAKEIRGPVICSLARAHPNDVDQAWEAIKGAESPVSTYFFRHPTSKLCTNSGRIGKRLWRWL